MKLGQLLSFIDLDLPPEVRSVVPRGAGQAARRRAAGRSRRHRTRRPRGLRGPGRRGVRVMGAPSRWPPPRSARSTPPSCTTAARSWSRCSTPGVADAVRSDLSNAEMFAPLARWFSPNQELEPLLDELRERIDDELDYEREAQYQRAFADRYADHPFIVVPDVVGDLCRNRVLVSERIHGRRFDEVAAGGDDALRQRVGEIIFRYAFGSIARFRLFNGDPHPGNYLDHRRRPGGLPRLRQRQDVHARAVRVDAARRRRGRAGRPGGLPRRDARDPVPPTAGRHRRGHALGLVPALHATRSSPSSRSASPPSSPRRCCAPRPTHGRSTTACCAA